MLLFRFFIMSKISNRPDSNAAFPNPNLPRLCFIKNVVKNHRIIIGANSVVASDIPPYAVAAGNPCRVIRKRFDDEFIAYLLDLKWWDWDIEKIEANLEALSSGDLTLIKKIGK